MSRLAVETGLLKGGLPFARLGRGARRLVIFPGLADSACDASSRVWEVPSPYEGFAAEFTVYVVSRKPNLPAGCTTREMAADYAAAFEHDIGPATVMGISLGGYIAQYLAIDFPQHVQRLVIACAACCVSEEGRKIPERWLALAGEERWREFYFAVAKVTIEQYQQTFYQFLVPLLRGKLSIKTDFLVSLRACLAHDTSALLDRIKAPTLVIGGTDDMFFPPALLRRTARGIPGAALRLIDAGSHGAYDLHRKEFEQAVSEFLHHHPTVPL
jgi:pimeloyl-ACP methyl ester carboxylesterase